MGSVSIRFFTIQGRSGPSSRPRYRLLILIGFGPWAAAFLFTIQTALNLSITSQCDQNSSDTRWAVLTIESEISVKLFFSLADPFDPYPIGTTAPNR